MAATLQEAQAKWERKTQGAGERWKAGVSGKEAEYCRGLAKFGVSEAECLAKIGRRWSAGVGAVSPSGFQAAIAGKGAKWASGFQAGLRS